MNDYSLRIKSFRDQISEIYFDYKNSEKKLQNIASVFLTITGVLLIVIHMIDLFTPNLIPKNLKQFFEFASIAGLTFVANSLVSLIRDNLNKNKEKDFIKKFTNPIIDEIFIEKSYKIKEWLSVLDNPSIDSIIDNGIIKLYNTQEEAFTDIVNRIKDQKLFTDKKECEIICYDGLNDFIGKINDIIIVENLNKGLNIKIISANPNLIYWNQHEIDEELYFKNIKSYDTNGITYTYRRHIDDLVKWKDNINSQIKKPMFIKVKSKEENNISIKFTNSLPSLFYFRIGDIMFVSCKTVGHRDSESPTITIECRNVNGNCMYKHYSDYFKKMWNDENVTSKYAEIILNPKLMIGNNIINKILQNTCASMTAILRNIPNLPDNIVDFQNVSIRAFLSIIDFGEPYKTNNFNNLISRRYCTNAVDRYGAIEIEKYNDTDKNGYPINESNAISQAIIKGTTLFSSSCTEPKISHNNIKNCANLVFPLKASKENTKIIWFINNKKKNEKIETRVIATITFEFDEKLESLIISNDNKENKKINDIMELNHKNNYDSKINNKTIKINQSTARLLYEGEERCKKLLMEYFGLEQKEKCDWEIMYEKYGLKEYHPSHNKNSDNQL